jgi:hypothetical protein
MVVISSNKVERLWIQKGKGRGEAGERILMEIWHVLTVTMYILLF